MNQQHRYGAPKAAVGANPDLPTLLNSTANGVVPLGVQVPPPVPVGLVLRDAPQGSVIYEVPAAAGPGVNGVAYLVVTLDTDFKANDLMLAGDLQYLLVSSWTSNGIRDQNLLAETGIPAEAFSIYAYRSFGFDCAPTAARQQIVIKIENTRAAPSLVRGLVAGTCGDCNTYKR